MKAAPSDSRANKRVIGKNVAGASGGTIFVLLAKNLPENSTLRQVLILAAPTITVGFREVTAWLWPQLASLLRDWRLKRAIERGKRTAEAQLISPGTSEKHKALVRRKLEELERIQIVNDLRRVQDLAQNEDPISQDEELTAASMQTSQTSAHINSPTEASDRLNTNQTRR